MAPSGNIVGAAPTESSCRLRGLWCVPVTDYTTEVVSDDDINHVWIITQLRSPRTLNEILVNEINYYVPEDYVSKKRAKVVAQAIVELQKQVPMPGVSVPKFPHKVEKAYVERVREFLRTEGEGWGMSCSVYVDPTVHQLIVCSQEYAPVDCLAILEQCWHDSRLVEGTCSVDD